jgi:hypothetical protein
MWGDERKNKGGEHKELQDLDPNRFPHLEEIMIGGDVDLDLLSLFPSRRCKNHGRDGEVASSKKINNRGQT